MAQPTPEPKFPLLESLIARRGLSLLPIYTNRDVAALFGVKVRTIQDWIRADKLIPRKLPGHGRFLPEDLEAFLQSSGNNIGGRRPGQ